MHSKLSTPRLRNAATYDTASAVAPLIQNENGKCRLPAVSCRGCTRAALRFAHTLLRVYRPHAGVALTPLSDHVVVTANGKESFITHTRRFLQLSKWFSCVLRDEYKAVWCSATASRSTHPSKLSIPQRQLMEVQRRLDDVKDILQHEDKMLNTPPLSVEDSCCLSALRCFRANLNVHFNATEKIQSRLYRSLKSEKTEKLLCVSTNSGDNKATCQACDSYPKGNVTEFFESLESLIQEGLSRMRG